MLQACMGRPVSCRRPGHHPLQDTKPSGILDAEQDNMRVEEPELVDRTIMRLPSPDSIDSTSSLYQENS
jgi:hypothetical protein